MKRFWLCFLLLVLPATALAGTPFQFAAPNVRAPDDPDVNGMRLSLFHGTNRSVRGFDLGVLSLTETAGLTGASVVFGIGRTSGNMTGLSTSLINVHSGVDTGLNAAFVNRLRTMKNGANIGFVNIADELSLVDLGGLNVSDRSAVQIGFVNVTREIDGLQIGFLNLAENGFLPFFPFFNFPKN